MKIEEQGFKIEEIKKRQTSGISNQYAAKTKTAVEKSKTGDTKTGPGFDAGPSDKM